MLCRFTMQEKGPLPDAKARVVILRMVLVAITDRMPIHAAALTLPPTDSQTRNQQKGLNMLRRFIMQVKAPLPDAKARVVILPNNLAAHAECIAVNATVQNATSPF